MMKAKFVELQTQILTYNFSKLLIQKLNDTNYTLWWENLVIWHTWRLRLSKNNDDYSLRRWRDYASVIPGQRTM